MVTQPEKNQRICSLMLAGCRGDKLAYAGFLKEISSDLQRFLQRRMPKDDVEDVLQEILISIHKARHTYDGERPILPWVSAIARFRLNDYLRKHYARAKHATVDISDFQDNIAAPVTESGADTEYLDEALSQLPQRQQKIIHLMHTQGYTAKEVGGQLDMNESAVKVAAHRAYKLIRARLNK